MAEFGRIVKPRELFGRSSFGYEYSGIKEFIQIRNDFETIKEKAESCGFELSSLLIADLEIIWRVQKPGAKIGEEELIIHALPNGTFWLADDQVEAYERFFESGGAVG